jgi:hypothetical protein
MVMEILFNTDIEMECEKEIFEKLGPHNLISLLTRKERV